MQPGTISTIAGIDSAKLFGIGTDTLVGTADTVVAGTNDPTFYTITFNGVAAGSYRLVLLIGTDVVAIEPSVDVDASSWSVTPAPSGGGARTVTITVHLASAPLEGAVVRITKGAESFSATTNASGQVTFNVNDGTWRIAIVASGASFNGANLVVDGDETPAPYSMTVSTPPASTLPNSATGQYLCVGATNVPQANVKLFLQMIQGPGQAGITYDSPIRRATSGNDGMAYFTDLVRGAKFRVWRNYEAASSNAAEFTVPATGEYFNLPEIL